MVLKIVDDQGRVQERDLEGEELTIGRDASCGLVLAERNVSRKHARIFKKGEGWVLEDLGSRYGLYLNGDKLVGPTTLQDGDTIKIGDFAFAVDNSPAGGEVRGTAPMIDALDADLPFDDDGPTGERVSPLVVPPSDTAPYPAQRTADDSSSAASAKDEPPARPSEGRPTAAVAAPPIPKAAPREGAGSSVQPQFRMKLSGLSPAVTGKELVLERSLMTVGRTPENDLVIDHRSVSSAHARVAFENGHFIVYDLGSTNGVLVNGEPYQSCVLQYNDEIQFGHVKFRFVRPSDRFEAAAASVPSEGGSGRSGSAAKLAALIVLVVASVLAGVLYVTRFSKDATDVGADQPPAAATVPAKAEPAKAEPKVVEPAARLEEAKKLLDAEKFPEARALLQEVYAQTKDTPGLVSANALAALDRLGKEEAAKKLFDEVVVLKAQDKTPEAYALLQEGKGDVPADTVYGKRLEGMDEELRVAALGALVKRAEDALAKEQPDAALEAAKAALAISPDNSGATAIVQRATDLKAAQERKAVPAPKAAPAAVPKKVAADPAPAKPAVVKAAPAPAPAPAAPQAPSKVEAKPAGGADPDAGLSGLDLFKKAIQAKSQGKLNDAKEYCYKATQKSYAPAHKMLGNIFQTELNFKKAAYHFKQYLAASPNAPDAAPIQTLILQLENK